MKNLQIYCDKRKFQYDGHVLRRGIRQFEKTGEGLESKVFKINNRVAFKLYKDTHDKAKIDEKMINELSQIETKRIVLPNNIIKTEQGTTKGYSMDYIEESDTDIIDFSKEQLVKELSLLKEDLIELGENNVEIGDLREENTISNDKEFYLIDCGDYLKREEETTKVNLQFFNDYMVEDVLTELVFEEAKDILDGLELIQNIRSYLYEGNFIADYFDKELNEDESINEYVKRKVN